MFPRPPILARTGHSSISGRTRNNFPVLNCKKDDKMITGHAEDPLFENKYPIYDKKFNVMEMEKAPTPPLMENPHQREIMTRFAALNHPEISRAYWWQGLSHFFSSFGNRPWTPYYTVLSNIHNISMFTYKMWFCYIIVMIVTCN